MPAFVTSAALTAALNAAGAAPSFAKDPAYIDSLIAALGANPRRRVVWAGTEVFNATVSGSCTRSGTQLLVPAVTANASGSATITSGSGYHRVEKASDPTVYIESLVDEEVAGLAGRISGNIVAGQPLALAQAVYNGPGLDPLTNYVDTIVDDMRANTVILNNAPDQQWMKGGAVIVGADLRSVAVPSWWGGNTFSGSQSHWTHLLPWYVVYDAQGHTAGRNVRVRLRDLALYVLEDTAPTTWRLVDFSQGPPGNSYSRGVSQTGGNASGRLESDGSYSAKLEPNGDIYHGYGNGTTNFDPTRLIGVHARMRVQLILENPAGPDERSQVAYAVNVGLDPRPFAGVTWAQLQQSYLPGSGSSRWRLVENVERVVSFTNLATALSVDTSSPYNARQVLTEAALRAAPPPAF